MTRAKTNSETVKHNACSSNEQDALPVGSAIRADRPLFEVTVPGRPIVKKNTQKVVRAPGRRFPVKVDSERYRTWKLDAAAAIRAAVAQRPGLRQIRCQVRLEVIFYFASAQSEPDLSNLYEGIQDVLVSEGVLHDDRLIYSHDGSTKVIGDPRPRAVVRIWPYRKESAS